MALKAHNLQQSISVAHKHFSQQCADQTMAQKNLQIIYSTVIHPAHKGLTLSGHNDEAGIFYAVIASLQHSSGA